MKLKLTHLEKTVMENMIGTVDKDSLKNCKYTPYVHKDRGKYRHVSEKNKDKNRHKLKF